MSASQSRVPDVTDDDTRGPSSPDYKPGDVANGHVLTEAGWMPLRRRAPDMPGPYYAGDVVGAHVYTGTEWAPLSHTPTPVPTHTPRPGFQQRPAHRPTAASTGFGPIAPRPAGRTWMKWVGIGVAVLFVIGLIGSAVEELQDDSSTTTANDSTTSATTPAAEPKAETKKRNKPRKTPSPKPTPTTAAPDPAAEYANKMRREGWERLDDNIWGRWEATDSNQFAVTFKLRVVSEKGCPYGVYAAANVLDTSNTVIGFTNDYLPTLAPNQQAVLDFMVTAEGQISISLNEVNCR